jgi:nitrate/TMAO reductase-like tetraheme cytochrome c subunit
MMRRFFRWCWATRVRRWTVIALPPLFVIANIGLVEATSHSSFCKSCHIMEPYFDSWNQGAHGNVQCVKCHIDPGVDSFIHAKLNGLGQVVDDVLHRTSTKPSASVSVLACTRPGCHTVETLNNRKIDTGTFRFDHSKHVGREIMGLTLQCGTCHAHVKGGADAEHFEVNTDACITCHLTTRYYNGGPPSPTMRSEVEPVYMKVRDSSPASGAVLLGAENKQKAPPASCKTCHNAPTEPFDYHGLTIDHTQFLSFGAACESCHRNVTAKPEPIDDAKCLSCHTFGVEKMLPREEMHKVHAEGRHKVECFSCHGVTRHGKDAQSISVNQFECKSCHQDQHAVQQQTYLLASGPAPQPTDRTVSPMFLAHVDCAGCHTKHDTLSTKPHSGATVAKASAEACDRCHQPGLGARMIPRWQADTRALFDAVEAQLRDLPQPEGPSREAAEAASILNLIRTDNSWGVHNPRYTQELLERARTLVRQVREGGGTPLPPAPPPTPAGGVTPGQP